jgi:hypothetical protein
VFFFLEAGVGVFFGVSESVYFGEPKKLTSGTGERVFPTGWSTEVTERRVLDSITEPNEHTFS